MIEKLLLTYNGRFIQKGKIKNELPINVYDTLNDIFVLRVLDYIESINNSPSFNIKLMKEDLDKYLLEDRDKKINDIL